MKEYYFTFGFGHHQPDRSLSNHYTIVSANSATEARQKMVERRGSKWSFNYDSAEQAGVEKYNLIFIPFNKVVAQVGPTL